MKTEKKHVRKGSKSQSEPVKFVREKEERERERGGERKGKGKTGDTEKQEEMEETSTSEWQLQARGLANRWPASCLPVCLPDN